MTNHAAPKIDGRSAEDVFDNIGERVKKRLGIPTTGEDPLTEALLRIFACYCGITIHKLNQAPNKNHIAFLDLLGVGRNAPVPACAPLTFVPVRKLPQSSHPIVVPERTRVAATAGDGGEGPIVFETISALELTNAVLQKAVVVHPVEDVFVEQNISTLPLAGDAGESTSRDERPVRHEFFVEVGEILDAGSPSRLGVYVELEGGLALHTDRRALEWFIPTPQGDVSLVPLKDTTSQLTQPGRIVFENMPKWPPTRIFNRETHWLGCRLLGRLSRQTPLQSGGDACYANILRIRAVKISMVWEIDDAPLWSAFYNNLPLDLSRDFFPLGERPRVGDVFYVACDVFTKPGANIVLKIKPTKSTSEEKSATIRPRTGKDKPTIKWEQWDGRRWSRMDCNDTTHALTEAGEVSFSLPSACHFAVVNGVEGPWIRARLMSGGYGDEERLEFGGDDQTLKRIPSTLAPPSIQSITVTAIRKTRPCEPDVVVTNNNFVFEEVVGTLPFRPFQPAADVCRILYLGFGIPDRSQHRLIGRTFSVYFHVSSSVDRTYIRSITRRQSPTLSCQYWNGRDWKEAGLSDTTRSLTLCGTVSVEIGADIVVWREASLEPDLLWIRFLLPAGDYENAPKLQRVLLNTVLATQTVTLENEVLGSSNGKPSQIYRSLRVPILQDLHLEVREFHKPSAADLKGSWEQDGNEDITTMKDSKGNIDEAWVRWHEVQDFLDSGRDDRHFVVDRHTGEIRFGNGIHGSIPAVGTNNIRLGRYQTGGGAFGNKPPGSIKRMRTSVPYVDSVANLEPAFGGQDMESWGSVRERGSTWLRHRGRAVTFEDYEDIAKLASPLVAKVKCYPVRDLVTDPSGQTLKPGSVSLVVVPVSMDSKPLPDLGLLQHVADFLDERRVVGTDLNVLAPEYVRIAVEAVIVSHETQLEADVTLRCGNALAEYLHPITGGSNGHGWDFGQQPPESAFYMLLESVRGVKRVRSLRMEAEEDHPGLLDSGQFLVCSGEHVVRFGL